MSSPEESAQADVVRTALLVEGGLALVALALGWLFGTAPVAQIDWTMRDWGRGLLAAVPMIVGLVVMDRYPLGPIRDLERIMRDAVVPLFRDCSLGELLLISILAGLGEEMLFRGVAQVGLERLLGSPWVALAVASLLFGLAHPITATYAVVAGLIGVYLGWLLLATGNLLVPITTHAAYDFVALAYLVWTDTSRGLPGELPGPADEGSL